MQVAVTPSWTPTAPGEGSRRSSRNLPPRKMMGIPSCGMLISAVHKEHGEEKVNLMLIDDSVPAGAKLC